MYKLNLGLLALILSFCAFGNEFSDSIEIDYENHLSVLFDFFHRNPELSTIERKTAKRMAEELNQAGFEVTEGIGGTGVVALMRNGKGPLVMVRADMDGLPIEEKTGLENASITKQISPVTGEMVNTMHACGHDVHITSLVGTARYMASNKNIWKGTLMLVVQPAEERGLGAIAMREDNIWKRFGTPDYVLAFHVNSLDVAGKININEGSPYAGVDTVDIVIHGIGAHGAHPYAGKDPIVLGSQIVLALQTLISRELSPREPAVVTVGSFHSGTKHNIIPDKAHLQLTVRFTSFETRKILLDGIKRIAKNMGRAAGLPDNKLPEVFVSDEYAPPTINNRELAVRLKAAWKKDLGDNRVIFNPSKGMSAEDFSFFTNDPYIKSVYWKVGGTFQKDFDIQAAGGKPVPSHHSALFKIEPKPSITTGIESTVVALKTLMPK